MKQIATALLKAQSEMSNPIKGSNNPYFKSKYADLNAVREAVIPILNAHEVVVLQPIVNIEGRNFVKTILLHSSGETIESFTEIIYAKTNDAQAQGSGITYARRYGLQSLVCIGADDDDGNAASKLPEIKDTKPPVTTSTVNANRVTAQISTTAPEQGIAPPQTPTAVQPNTTTAAVKKAGAEQVKVSAKPKEAPKVVAEFDIKQYEEAIKAIKTKAELQKYWGDHKDERNYPKFVDLITKQGKLVK